MGTVFLRLLRIESSVGRLCTLLCVPLMVDGRPEAEGRVEE
jgi:hypothetical protein